MCWILLTPSHQLLLWRSLSTKLLHFWKNMPVWLLWSSCYCEAFTFGHSPRQHAGLSESLLWSGTRICPVLIRADTSCKKVGFPGTEEDEQQRVQIQVKKHNWKIFSSLPLCCWLFKQIIYLPLRCFHCFTLISLLHGLMVHFHLFNYKYFAALYVQIYRATVSQNYVVSSFWTILLFLRRLKYAIICARDKVISLFHHTKIVLWWIYCVVWVILDKSPMDFYLMCF